MNKIKPIYCILAIIIGVFIVVYGGIDDSPGAQLIGLIAFIAGIVGLIRGRKKL